MRVIGIAVVLGLFLLAPLAAEGQQAGKVYRLGILTTSAAEMFEQELRSLGYVEGRNISSPGGTPTGVSKRRSAWPRKSSASGLTSFS